MLSTAGILLQGVSRLAYTVLIGRAFGAEVLGHASTMLSLSIFAALLWPTAAGTAASRFLALAVDARSDDRAVSRFLGRSALASACLTGMLAVPLGVVLGVDLPTSVSAAWLVAGYGVYAYARGARLGRHKPADVALWDGVTAALSLALLVVVVLVDSPVVVLVPLSMAYTVFAVACWPRVDRAAGGPALMTTGVVSFTAWNVLAGLTTNGLLQLAMVSAQIYRPGVQAGIYAAAFTLATPLSMVGQAVAQIVVPAFAARSDGAVLRDVRTRNGLLALVVVLAAAFGGVALVAPWFLPLFYPTVGAAAVPVLQFLVVGVFVFTVALVPAAFLLASGRSREVAVASIGGFVLGAAVIALLGPSVGIAAGTVGFLSGSTVNLVAMLVLSSRTRPSLLPEDRARGASDDQ